LSFSKQNKKKKKKKKKTKEKKNLFIHFSFFPSFLLSLNNATNIIEWILLINNYLRFFRSCFTFHIMSSIHAIASSALSCPSTTNSNPQWKQLTNDETLMLIRQQQATTNKRAINYNTNNSKQIIIIIAKEWDALPPF